ncbi:cupredoxin domain-containing protein [Heliophilum fasciatum]|uniref:Cupredoxin-like protein n=1 Tax=Heliophilum fasciatum TaxID=35700 RepID=A0A4R2RL02_9FIRM|nr:hypothetical protein [Heliophilum fasciatum]MCW2278575.1 plastocyanin domain-containing protein [Heliophilum fasciatum]TCP63528.1 hypothetical protein EDD73_11871 [Heliophilum fasciatum]
MLSRGIHLSGINITSFALAASGTAKTAGTVTGRDVAKIEGKSQIVESTIEAGRYRPIVVQKGIPVTWTIYATDKNLNGCNNPVTIPKFNMEKTLVPGANVIEFIPMEEGTITYTCWMGMISSTITVVNDLSQLQEKDLQLSNPAGSSRRAYGMGCCN